LTPSIRRNSCDPFWCRTATHDARPAPLNPLVVALAPSGGAHPSGRAQAVPAQISAPVEAMPQGGSETILVVEHDLAVLQVTTETLTRAGYTVLDAPSAGAALETEAQHTGPLDLLITGVLLPDCAGAELAARLTATHPELKVLFVSAYAGDPDLPSTLDATHRVLEKPFSPRDVLRRVRQFLDDSDSGRGDNKPA